jgi:GTP-binding protein HflX
MRRLELEDGPEVILSDTVGFISDLPTELVAAFRATLEEVLAADLILHVRDISHDETDNQAEDVAKILASLGVDENIPQLEVWNKIDQMEADDIEASQARSERSDDIFAISAITGEGIDALLSEIATRLQGEQTTEALTLPFSAGKERAWLFAEGVIESESQSENGFELTVKWTGKQAAQFKKL